LVPGLAARGLELSGRGGGATDGETVAYKRDIDRDGDEMKAQLLDDKGCVVDWNWKPNRLAGMYMPTWAARTFRRIVQVRQEKLQAITEEDAQAEGVEPCNVIVNGITAASYRFGFLLKWDAINSTRPGLRWADNPTITVVRWDPKPVPPAEVEALRSPR
jgi:hypothetical protein